jgi:alkanesulfonate monooxygenase SsuD/methylene tetrahydromethanopterin reductase-like flavin-dependent oxidoreductase (luciferase family)
MRAVWGPDPVSFEGRFYRIPEADIGPNWYGRTARD